MQKEELTFYQYICYRCGHLWMPKYPRFPDKCPFCNSYSWHKLEKDKESGPPRAAWHLRPDPQRYPDFFLPDGKVNPAVIALFKSKRKGDTNDK